MNKETTGFNTRPNTRLVNLQQKAKKQAILEGHFQGGVVPYGYQRAYDPEERRFVLKLDPYESTVLKHIFQEYLKMKSLGKLAGQLNQEGIMNRQHKPWSRAALAYAISNEVYLGKVKYGELKAPARHQPIIAPIIYNKAQMLKRENNKRR